MIQSIPEPSGITPSFISIRSFLQYSVAVWPHLSYEARLSCCAPYCQHCFLFDLAEASSEHFESLRAEQTQSPSAR